MGQVVHRDRSDPASAGGSCRLEIAGAVGGRIVVAAEEVPPLFAGQVAVGPPAGELEGGLQGLENPGN